MAISYSSASGIYPSRSNYATMTGTFTTYSGSRVISRETVTLIPVSSSDYLSIEENKIYWNKDKYGKTVVTARDIPVNGSYRGIVSEGTVNLRLYANYANRYEQTTSWSPSLRTNYIGNLMTFRGGEIRSNSTTNFIGGNRSFNYWTEYTSGERTTSYESHDFVYATDYNVDYSINWISKQYDGDGTYVYVSSNNTYSKRSADIQAIYSNSEYHDTGITQTITIQQYEHGTQTTEYQITECSVTPSVFAATTYGQYNPATILVKGRYRTNRTEDGTTIPGTWQTYTGGEQEYESIVMVASGGGNFGVENLNYESEYTIPLSWNPYGEGRAYVYAKSANTETTPRNGEIRVVLGNTNELLDISQSGSVAKSLQINLNNAWMTMTSPSTSYKGFKSQANKGKGGHDDVAIITLSGYTSFGCYIRSDAESTYDYTMIGTINGGQPTSSTSSNCKAHTSGNQHSGTTLSDYTYVSYPGLNENTTYTIYVVYHKDSSMDRGSDEGYVLLPSEASYINPYAQPYITPAVSTLSIPASGITDGTVAVTSNVSDWTAASTQSWLTAYKTTGQQQFRYNAEQNPSSTSRTATINLNYSGSTLNTVSVTQNGAVGYTMLWKWDDWIVPEGQEIWTSDESITFIDFGTNPRNYDVGYRLYAGGFNYRINGNEIEFYSLNSDTDVEVTITERTSGLSLRFNIMGE